MVRKKKKRQDTEIVQPTGQNLTGAADTSDEPVSPYGEIFMAWEYPSHDQVRRGIRWYIIAGIFIAAILVYTYFTGNFLLAVIVILGVFVFAISEYRGADVYTFAITQDGLLTGQTFYPYSEIRNFFIIFEPPVVAMLYFDPKTILRPLIGIPLQSQDPNVVRKFLLTYLPEDLDREKEPTSDLFGRLLKF